MTSARMCQTCKHWRKIGNDTKWGQCMFVDFDFAGKLAYLFGYSNVVQLRTRDVFYCAQYEHSVLHHRNLTTELSDQQLDEIVEAVQQMSPEELKEAIRNRKTTGS